VISNAFTDTNAWLAELGAEPLLEHRRLLGLEAAARQIDVLDAGAAERLTHEQLRVEATMTLVSAMRGTTDSPEVAVLLEAHAEA